MEKKEFMETVKKELKKKTGCEVVLKEVIKQNGVCWNGVIVQREGNSVLPVVYLDRFYEEYQTGRSLEKIVEMVWDLSENWKPRRRMEQVVWNYEKAKHKIAYKLVNREKNEGFLKEMPHEPFLDLEKLYYVVMEEEEGWRASMMIRNQQLEIWGITEEELKQQAEKNMNRLFPARVQPILEAIQGVMGTDWKGEGERTDLFVLSNTRNYYGAAVVAYDGFLKEIAKEWKSDFVILPSSVHEMILCPIQKEENLGDLVELVKEINETEVSEEEVLSDHVYLYEKESGNLVIV